MPFLARAASNPLGAYMSLRHGSCRVGRASRAHQSAHEFHLRPLPLFRTHRLRSRRKASRTALCRAFRASSSPSGSQAWIESALDHVRHGESGLAENLRNRRRPIGGNCRHPRGARSVPERRPKMPVSIFVSALNRACQESLRPNWLGPSAARVRSLRFAGQPGTAAGVKRFDFGAGQSGHVRFHRVADQRLQICQVPVAFGKP